jgi:hypothetical protein
VAYLFVEKRTGQKRDGIPYVSSRDVETAKELLRTISLDRMGDFLDFALSEARRTRFDLQTLGGVRQYLNSYLLTSDRRAIEKAKASARLVQEAEEQLKSEYAGYLRTAAGKLLESRPAHEKAAIEDLARARAHPPIGGTGFLSNTLFELERTRLTIDRYPGKVLSFDQWKVSVAH